MTFLAVYIFAAQQSFAQSDFDFSQRHLNQSVYNPAATGNDFSVSVYTHARAQWVGMPGAPYTEAIGFNSYLYGYNSAIGFSMTGDQIGFTNTYLARLTYAYYFDFSKRYTLSLGLAGALMNRSQNASGALVDDLTDGELYHGNISEYRPDFDFGIELNGVLKDGFKDSAPKDATLRIGLSFRHFAPKLSSNYFKPYSSHLWAYASTDFKISGNTFIEPVASVVYRDKFSRFELGSFLYFKRIRFNYNKYWIAGMWRFNGQFSILAGISPIPNIKIGYSFDHAASELARISSFGTHEIFISWQRLRSNKCDICPGGTKGNKLVEDVSKKFYVY